jgi:hypothetical protein
MGDLKARMIAAVNQSDPHLRKIDVGLRGINGDLEKADDEAITTLLASGQRETHAWSGLGPKASQNLIRLAVRDGNGGDCLAAGLLALVGGDTATAARDFEKAHALGADAASCQALLAAMDLAKAKALLDKKQYVEAGAALVVIGQKYGNLPWYAANKADMESAAGDSKRGLHEAEAGRLYAQAAALLQQRELFALKPIVERLRTEFADTSFVIDSQRQPPFAEMERAMAGLGRLIRVARDGKADARGLQEAIDAAPPNSMIEIDDDGPYSELLMVPSEKDGLTIRGRKGRLPTLTTAGAKNSYSENLIVRAPRLRLERLIIVRATDGPLGLAITAGNTELACRGVVLLGHADARDLDLKECVLVGRVHARQRLVAGDCAAFGNVQGAGPLLLDNVLVGRGAVHGGPDSQIRHCTINADLQLDGTSCSVKDSIVRTIRAVKSGVSIDYCDVFGDNPYQQMAVAGKGCFSKRPEFADDKAFDFRLLPGSPCRRTAAENGNMGFTATPDLQVLLQATAELRRRHAAESP